MNRQTEVRNMKLKEERLLLSEREQACPELIEYPPERGFGRRLLQTDKLIRNLAVVGGLLLTLVAVKNADTPQSQSVFSALQDSVHMEWDESLGKLSFVNSYLPESLQAVWSERESVTVLAPMVGETVHAWSEAEPYLELQSAVTDVRVAADGEVMSIAHGMGEERIVRVRHDDETESIYGNLLVC
ncbi:MAG: hypothetical protein RR367_03835, partial [Clostridia bacterium]